jgi:hypothetical protein
VSVQLPHGKAPIKFALELVAKIEGVGLPFRLRVATSNHVELIDRLREFMDKINRRLDHLKGEYEITEEDQDLL